MNTFSNVDLISLIESDLGHGQKSGRWMRYHCPFPGHKHGDRNPSLAVANGDQNRGPVWKCFACGKQGGPAKWVMEYRNLSYPDALRYLRIPLSPTTDQRRPEPPVQQPYPPPSEVWQERALRLIKHAEAALWSDHGKQALAWLQARGLLTSEWTLSDSNRRVKQYTLTEQGRAQLRAERSRWENFSTSVSRVLDARRPRP